MLTIFLYTNLMFYYFYLHSKQYRFFEKKEPLSTISMQPQENPARGSPGVAW